MAGGKLTPRQKMVNLMYLVFIAMLALNMSKEVLSAFGLMNEKFESANQSYTENTTSYLSALESKATDSPEQYGKAYQDAKAISQLSNEFYTFVGSLKAEFSKDVVKDEKTGKLPYESMDKADAIDQAWFLGDGYSKEGKAFVDAINSYRTKITAILDKNPKLKDKISEVNKTFNSYDVKDKEGISKKFLDYHFKGFPLIASLTKLTAMQNDVRKLESDIYSSLIGNSAIAAASMKNYTAIVIPEKSAFFSGETVKGKIVLGRFDKNTVPTSVTVNGSSINLASALQDGQVNFSFGAGNVGEHDITGKFTFMEDGKPVPIDIKGNYVVVPKPNSATISADKMNVVYRGVPNPISVSIAGISTDKIVANAPGMVRGSKAGQYVLNPGAGNTVTISVVGTLSDGSKVTDQKEFRIKGLPAPTGKIRGEVAAKGPKSNLEVCTISADLEDFDFPVSVQVTQFTIKVPGQPAIVVSGSRLDSRAKSAVSRAQKGDVVIISDIKAKFSGIDQLTKRVSTCTYEIN